MTRSWPPPKPGEKVAFYEALQEVLRIYQFRDRDRACYGDVTPHECYALEAIERAGRVRVGDLATSLGLHKSNASRLAAALEEKGYIERREGLRDGRSVSLAVTARGRAVHATIRNWVQQVQGRILAGFPPGVRHAFVNLLRALAAEAAERLGRARECPHGDVKGTTHASTKPEAGGDPGKRGHARMRVARSKEDSAEPGL